MFLIKLIAAIAYISLGLPDSMLGIAWPSIRGEFGVPINHLGFLLAATFTGYLISSSLANKLARSFGIGGILAGSGLMMTLVLVGFATSLSFYLLVGLGFIGGLGGGAIDASMNSFTAHRFSMRMLNWLHGCWGIGAFCGPMLMTYLLVDGQSWRVGYGILAGVLGATTIMLFASRQRWSFSDYDSEIDKNVVHPSLLSVIKDRQVAGQCFLFFLYTGIESSVGQLMFSLWTEGRGVAIAMAGSAITAYWIAFTASRFLFGQLSTRISARSILIMSSLLAPVLSCIIAFPPFQNADLIAVVLLGIVVAPIFPTWIGITPQTVRPNYAATAIGFQVSAAAIGIATLPAIITYFATYHGLEFIAWALVATIVVLSMTQLALLRNQTATRGLV